MRSITFVQAFQYWLKLTALLIPTAVLLVVWAGDGAPNPADVAGAGGDLWSLPLGDGRRRGPLRHLLADHRHVPRHHGPPARGRPLLHQPRRPGRAPDHARGARAARHVLPAPARCTAPSAASTPRSWPQSGRTDALVLELPRLMLPGTGGELLTGLVTAGAFAAFLSTSSGPGDRGRRRAQPGRHRPAVRRAPARRRRPPSGSAPRSPWSSPAWPRSPAPTSASPARSAWRSRSRPRRSARCCCSGSGGAA